MPENWDAFNSVRHYYFMNMEKAKAFWERKKVLREQNGNCSRCAKPNISNGKTCEKCRDYQKRYKESLRVKPVTVDNNLLDTLTRRVASLEMAIARLQGYGAARYKDGYRAGKRVERSYDRDDFKTCNFFDYGSIANR